METNTDMYFHGIDLNDWYPIRNISLNGNIMSPDYIASIDKGIGAVHHSLRDIPLERIMDTNPQPGVISPRAKLIMMASLIKNTGGVGIGENNTRWLNDQEKGKILCLANIELEFERVRRQVACDAASRLTCLWVAEHTLEGQDHIKKMFGPSIYIVTVDIPIATRITKTDTDWFNKYCMEPDEEYIQNYWASVPCTNNPKWEFLVDGVIRLVDRNQIDYIRTFGAKIT